MSAIAWTPIKNAIHAWIVATSGLAAKRVVYAGQNLARPAGDGAYIAIRVTTVGATSRPSKVQTNNPTPTPGAEIVQSYVSHERVLVKLTCYPPREATDATEAGAILTDVARGVELGSVQAALDAAGASLLNVGEVSPIDGVLNSTRFEPRALLTAVFSVASTVSETNTTIDTVSVELHVDANTYNFEIDLDP